MKHAAFFTALLFALSLIIVGVALAQDATAEPTENVLISQIPLRDVRYCEIIPVVRRGLRITAYVYNTLGLNDCPAELWNALHADVLAEDYGAISVKLNGPRYWVIDRLQGGAATAAGETAEFGGIAMVLRATLETRVGESTVGEELYQPNEVERTTTYTYLAGERVYELVSPEGDVYIMQSYSQIVDPELTIDELTTLGERLTLPEGWEYRTRVLDEDFLLRTEGLAYVINDDFLNSYQRIPPQSPG